MQTVPVLPPVPPVLVLLVFEVAAPAVEPPVIRFPVDPPPKVAAEVAVVPVDVPGAVQ